MRLIHGVGGWEKLNTRGAMRMIIRGDVKCEMRSAKCEVQNVKCEMGVRLQLRMRMWMRCLPVPVSHLPYIFFLLLSKLCLFSSARRTPSLSSAMSEWQPSSASSETRPAMSEWQLGLALASFSSLPDYPSVKLTSGETPIRGKTPTKRETPKGEKHLQREECPPGVW